MSNSYRKHSITSWCSARSHEEQWFKRYASGATRARVRSALAKGDFDTASMLTSRIHSSWTWPKDGKMFFDPTKFPKLMRK